MLLSSELPPVASITKRSLVSDNARTFDVLGWFSPAIVVAKILLQTLWLEGITWDESFPSNTLE
jgi:hypothetical protein